MENWSAPAVTLSSGRRPARPTTGRDPGQEDEKQVDYSHLDIVAEVERITGCSLKRVSRKGVYAARCPFPGCPSQHDAFTVWDIPALGIRANGKPEVHFWCRRCNKTGSLISLICQYREATTGETVSWADAARELRIDPRTWRAFDEGEQGEQRRSSASERRMLEAEQRRKAERAELELLDAAYPLACKILAAGQVVLNNLSIPLDQARAYLAERGFTLEQAAALGMGYIPTRQEIGSDQGKQIAAWRGRIVFPLSGPAGARGYAGRSLWKWKPGMSAEQHKALFDAWNEQHPDKPMRRHFKTLQAAYYGYDLACKAHTLVAVEGEFDAASVRLALGEIPGLAVCAFGKHFSPRLVPLNVLHVILALDGDLTDKEIARQAEELHRNGLKVEIVHPPAGKDWNECHQLAGLDAIRAAIVGQQAEEKGGKQRINEQADAGQDTCNFLQHSANIDSQQRIEPPGYENGDVCLLCGQKVSENEGAFMVDELGDLYCISCWERQNGPEETASDQGEDARAADCLARVQEIFDGETRGAPVWPEPYTLTLLPAGMSSADYIERWYAGERPGKVIYPVPEENSDQAEEPRQDEQFSAANHRCSKHGKPLAYSDEQGGRYCDHVDCWERYRLIRSGAARGYPALVGIIDRRTTADTSQPPLYYIDVPGSDKRLPVYPDRKPLTATLIDAGADAWRAYVASRGYQDIDQAIKALASA